MPRAMLRASVRTAFATGAEDHGAARGRPRTGARPRPAGCT
jgi:hypothetical protein